MLHQGIYNFIHYVTFMQEITFKIANQRLEISIDFKERFFLTILIKYIFHHQS